MTQAFADSTSSAPTAATQRQITLDAICRRPRDPWPRWQGHVPLGTPGSPRLQKAYHEPGGGFSPSPGSFGITLLLDANAAPRTIDEIPLADIDQHYVWPTPNTVPALQTRTPHHTCIWRLAGPDRWRGDFARPAGQLQFLIRSVGPAAAPVERLDFDAGNLIVNRRWVITFDPPPAEVHLGSEEETNWLTAASPRGSVDDSAGWAYARIVVSTAVASVNIRDTSPFFASPLAHGPVKSALTLNLPDAAFAASLDSQAATLLMGFVGRQTCPGEPTNYPLAWERDGAYAVQAMARCGQLETAKQLAVYYAENDFFGGFGAEGDAPGSSINALVTVALLANDADFQRLCWPHVKRKLAQIEEMAATRNEICKPWIGPIVPEHQNKPGLPIIARPPKDGLIMGSMDLHYPALYVTAMSYRGLRQAQRLAAVLGTEAEIPHAADLAARLRRAWRDSLTSDIHHNERTYMTGLWPTWIADRSVAAYRAALERRWATEHGSGTYPRRPLWTYFTVAEAHQWLFLDRPDLTWQTLRYFWANQSSPGLYTYWEGAREENTFGLWQHLRGWPQPAHVTPHYWTAAEMLLLQIDMLCYVDESEKEPRLVIGAGIPRDWLTRPFSAAGLPTLLGAVDFVYDPAGTLAVTVRGPRRPRIRAGVNFPATTRITGTA